MVNSPESRDVAFHLHSSTNAQAHEARGPFIIEKGEGIYVFDNHGNRYIEAMSGLWSVGLGFSEKRLIDAAVKQWSILPYYHTFYHRSNGPVIDLAEKLIALAPVPMSKVYFTNSGSEANDSVIKFVRYRANALGQPLKKKFISRKRAFHGVTIGAASLTGLVNNHKHFDLPLDGILHTTCPDYVNERRAGESEEQFASRCADDLEQLIIAEGPETVAAFIGEPLMGAGGVILPPTTYWEKIQSVLRRYDILLVIDEVICGFGRTGKMFGCETYGIQPDIMTLSKQLSSSYFPIAAVLMNQKVYEPIARLSGEVGVLGQGYTSSGHPVACAVALENIAIIEERQLVENVAAIGPNLIQGLSQFRKLEFVRDVRGIGLITAIEFGDFGGKSASDLAVLAFEQLLGCGVISRAVGTSIAFCPPLVITAEEIASIVERTHKALARIAATLGH